MTPQKQRYMNGAETDQYGDCHRTCIAMILNMDRDDVPHFMQDTSPSLPADHPDSKAAEQAERDWLEQFNLSPVYVPFSGDLRLFELMKMCDGMVRDAPVILGCRSGWQNHSVVIYKGDVYNPGSCDIHGPMLDGHWWLTIYSVGSNWQAPFRPLHELKPAAGEQ